MDSRSEPSPRPGRSENDSSNVLGLCFITQHVRGHLKDTLLPVIAETLEAGREAGVEVTPHKDMLYSSYEVRCLKVGCPAVMTCFESTLPGEETYLYSHSREELAKRGCTVAREKEEYELSMLKGRPTEPSS
jgi:hypothetical protein